MQYDPCIVPGRNDHQEEPPAVPELHRLIAIPTGRSLCPIDDVVDACHVSIYGVVGSSDCTGRNFDRYVAVGRPW
jgi:hypothetical protein